MSNTNNLPSNPTNLTGQLTYTSQGNWNVIGSGGNGFSITPTVEYTSPTEIDALKIQLDETIQKYTVLVDKYSELADRCVDLEAKTTTVYDIVTNGKCTLPLLDDPSHVISAFNDYVDEMITDAIKQEKTDLDSWKYDTFQPGDFLIFKLVPDIDPTIRKQFTQQVQQFLLKQPGVSVIIMPDTVRFMDIKESEMNRLGWKRM